MFAPRGNPQARNLFGIIGYLQKQAGIELRVTLRRSIFPQFDVNVPMPADIAVPGSYVKPPQQPVSNTPTPKPAQPAD